MADVRCSIQLAARKSGLSTHLIRMWQKRYGAVSPSRTETNRRLYSEAEIARLRLLKAAVDAGHRIGDVARLPDDELRRLSGSPEVATHAAPAISLAGRPDEVIAAGLAATMEMDGARLHQVLLSATTQFGFRGSLEKFFAPLMHRIGDLWRSGALSAAHEHFASAAVRAFLLSGPRTFAPEPGQPVLLVVTPAGQLHEVGAVLVAATAADLGWRVIFLGTNLPASEIAGAAIRNQARAVALSIVYPPDDARLPGELRLLRQALPETIGIIVGGRAADAYGEVCREIGAVVARDLATLEGALDARRLRGAA